MPKLSFELNETTKGLLFIVGGTVILLYAFNLLRGLNVIVIVGGFAMAAYGFYMLGAVQRFKQWTKNKQTKE